MTDRSAPNSLSSRRASMYLAALAVLGTLLLLYFMRTGIGIRGDSVRYVMGARNLLAGHGFARTSGGGEIYPETGFAPLLSFVLAGMGALGVDLFQGARILHAVLYGLNGLLVGWLVLRFTRSTIAALLGSLLFLLAPSIVEWHGWLMTEALFIFLTLLTVLTLLRFLDTRRNSLWVVAAGLAGAACLTRYVGLSMAPAGALAIFSLSRSRLRTRLPQAAAFAILAIMPFTLWMIRNQAVGDPGLANREILVHPIRADLLRYSLFEAASWALPEAITAPREVRALIALAVIAAGPADYFWARVRRRRLALPDERTEFAALPWLCLFYLASYLAVLVLNSVFLDAGTTFSAGVRYLTPFFAVLVVLEASTYGRAILEAGRPVVMRGLGIALALFLLIFYSLQTSALVRASTLSLGFTGIRERWAHAAQGLRELAGDHPILSNNPEVAYYLIDRPAYILPIRFDPYRQEERADFPAQLQLARERLESGSVIVIFEEPKPDDEEVLRLLDVVPLGIYPDVAIYGYPAVEPTPGTGG